MDRDGLAGLLRGAAGRPATVAVANIPYSKTIVEQQVLASLEDEADDHEGPVSLPRGWPPNAAHPSLRSTSHA